MAPKVSKAKGATSTGMVVTLVIFILLSIGLGISTYTGYSELDGANKKATDEKKAKDAMTKDRDWYKFQALLFKAHMGHLTQAEDQQTLQINYAAYKSNTFGPSQDAEKGELSRILANIEPKVKWDPAQAKAGSTYEKLLSDARTEIQGLQAQVADLITKKDAAELRVKQAEDKLVSAKKEYDDALAMSVKKDETDKTDLFKKKDELQLLVEQLGREKEVIIKRADEERKKVDGELARKNTEVMELKKKLQYKDDELAQLKVKTTDAPREWRTDWKIVRIERDANVAYINLGSADNVQDQLTFSIYGLDPNRKPLPISKGSLEVLNVVGQHLSQVRITNVKDRARDPILQGDVLYNPSWNPQLRKHVAITGVVDLTGEGRDNLQEFMRNLERQGIMVDAWLDLREMKVKGRGIGVQTDYLIIGDGLDYLSDSQANADWRKKLDTNVTQMQSDARNNGAQIISLRKYLEMIGYRLPRVTDRTTTYRPVLPVNDQPKDPPKDPAMPMEQPKDPPKEQPKDPPPPAKEAPAPKEKDKDKDM